MNLQQFRQKYPQYNDMSDVALASALHKKYYSDVPVQEFNQKIGLKQPQSFGQSVVSDVVRPAETLGADALSGVAQGMYGLGTLIPGFSKAVPKPESVNTALDLPQNTADKMVQGAASYIPVMMGGEQALPEKLIADGSSALGSGLLSRAASKVAQPVAKNALLGGIYGESQGESPAGNSLAAGGISAISPLAGEALGALKGAPGLMSKKIGKLVAPNVMQKFFSQDEPAGDVLGRAENQLRNNYQAVKDQTEQKYSNAGALAQKADEEIGSGKRAPLSYEINPFKNSDYLSSLHDIKNDLQSQAASAPAIATVNKWIENSPHSFSDAINSRKLINTANVNYMDPSFDALKGAADKARSSLIDSVNSNVAAHPNQQSVQDFGNAWADANEHYKNNQVPYTQTFKNGTLSDNKDLVQALKLQGNTTGGDLIKQFVPNGNSNDTNNIAHLGTLLGDDDLANNAAKASLLKNGYNTDGTPGLGFLTKHKNLSQNLKNKLFSQEENSALSNAQTVAQTKAGRKTVLNTLGAQYGLGALAGSGIGHLAGIPLSVSAGLGATLSGTGKRMILDNLSPRSLESFNGLFKGKDGYIQKDPPLLRKSPLLALGAIQGSDQK